MHSIAVWDDPVRNRKVLFRVNYRFQATGVRVRKITPLEVEFPAQNRSIQIWTSTARAMLLRQFRATEDYQAMVNELEDLALAGAL